jgi:hypothetical protein
MAQGMFESKPRPRRSSFGERTVLHQPVSQDALQIVVLLSAALPALHEWDSVT